MMHKMSIRKTETNDQIDNELMLINRCIQI